MMKKKASLRFRYKNWEGKVAIRNVKPIEIWYGSTEWHKKDQWFLKAFDLDRKAKRDFAVKDIIKFL